MPVSQEQLITRLHPRDEDVRGPFFRDQTAIIHSKSFRRLKFKTQVFFAPEDDHICTRIEHVLHVATIAATVCKGLSRMGMQLDDDMAYAAGLGHDLGHAPFGHSGERALAMAILQNDGPGFSHEQQTLRVVDHLTQNGRGLNLTCGVRDAMVCHNGEHLVQYLTPEDTFVDPSEKTDRNCLPMSTEGCIVRFADAIAYLGRDLEDARRMRLVRDEQLPADIRKELGSTNGTIINTLVLDLIENSAAQGKLGFSDKRFALMQQLLDFNIRSIYNHPSLKRYEQYCYAMIERLFAHYMQLFSRYGYDFDAYRELYLADDRSFGATLAQLQRLYLQEDAPAWRIAADYVSGMSDKYALACYQQLVIPTPLEAQ